MQADLQVAETKLEEEENKSKAQVKRFKKSKMRAPLGEGHDDPMRQLMKEYQGDADDAKEEDAAILDPTRPEAYPAIAPILPQTFIHNS